MSTQNPAPGEKSLTTLLSTLKLAIHPETFVFLTLPPSQSPPPTLYLHMTFREAEGLTIITTKESAMLHNLDYTFPSKMITLNIHSSLDAVGFMAAISKKLTEHSIGANPVSGFYHDHCFVPLGKELDAMNALEDLIRESKSQK
jgi:hypothetical protein